MGPEKPTAEIEGWIGTATSQVVLTVPIHPSISAI